MSGPGRPRQEEDEKELVERYRRGDGDALEILLARVEPDLRRVAERGLPGSMRRRASVSDVLQETRLTAFERRADFRYLGAGSFRRWVLGIAGNKVMQALRHHLGTGKRSARREERGPRGASPADLPGREPTPSQVAVAAELEILARRAMASLPPEEREVLRLAREQRLPMARIAESLGIEPGIAKRLYGRALVRFRASFDRLRGARRG